MVVATVVMDDMSYDKDWKNADDIYRILSINNNDKNAEEKSPLTFSGMGPTLTNTFPEVENYCRASVAKRRVRIGNNEDGIELNAIITEPSVWKVFDFKIQQGNPLEFIKGYTNLVITERFKRQYFKDSDPVGKIITNMTSGQSNESYLITGVIKEIPDNSHLRADVLVISEYNTSTDKQLLKIEAGTFYQEYLLLKPGTSAVTFTKKLNEWYENYITSELKATYSFQLQSVKDVYLESDFDGSTSVKGSIRNIYIFSVVAVLLLLIACINFINLTTARALKRVREVGIRKVMGAGLKVLIAQFLIESVIFFAISFVLGMTLYHLFIQSVEIYIGHKLTLTLTSSVLLFVCSCSFILLVSLFTGLYPAWVLSRARPTSVLSGSISDKTDNAILRKSLIIGQFVVSIIILISTLVIQAQLRYFNQKDLGYDKDNLMVIDYNSWGMQGQAFKQEILKLAAVQNVSIAKWSPGMSSGSMSMEIDDPEQKDNKLKVWYIAGDIDLVQTLRLQLLNGRMFNKNLSTDALNFDSLVRKDISKLIVAEKTQPVIMTAHTAKLLQMGKLNVSYKDIKGIPVGIIKDFNNESLRTGLKPCFITAQGNMMYGNMLIRISPGTQKWVIDGINRIWKQYYPERVLQYNWVDDLLNNQYRAEYKLQQLFTFFSLLIVFLACMGLFGLVSFSTEQRTKEIGIRKVLGATIADIVALVSKDFLTLVVIAFFIASPITLYIMNLWLQDYSYRIEIEWWMFILVGMFSVLIAFVTVSFQAIKAALMNPVKSLRSE